MPGRDYLEAAVRGYARPALTSPRPVIWYWPPRSWRSRLTERGSTGNLAAFGRHNECA